MVAIFKLYVSTKEKGLAEASPFRLSATAHV